MKIRTGRISALAADEDASWIAVRAPSTVPIASPAKTSPIVTTAFSAIVTRLSQSASATRIGPGRMKGGTAVSQTSTCQAPIANNTAISGWRSAGVTLAIMRAAPGPEKELSDIQRLQDLQSRGSGV